MKELKYIGRCVAVEAVNGGWVVIADLGSGRQQRTVCTTKDGVRKAVKKPFELLLINHTVFERGSGA